MADVLALLPYRLGTAGGQRTSIEAWERPLRESGIRLHMVPFGSESLYRELYRKHRTVAKTSEMILAYLHRISLVLHLEEYDAVFIAREAALVGPGILERWLAWLGIPMIYGLDDPSFIRAPSHFNGWLSLLKCPGKTAALCRLANAVIVNGSPLRVFAERHSDNVWVVPNLVDEGAYQPVAALAGTPPRLGWIGSPSTAFNLDVLAEPLSRLARRTPFELHLVGAERDRVGDVACSCTPWAAATEVEQLRQFDVGLLPLGDDPRNRWKFNYKLAQYMALGIPPVATPMGCNSELIQHGVTGLLADTPAAWERCLGDLLRDRELRQSIGTAAASFAAERFTVAANAERVVQAFRSALDRDRRGRRRWVAR